MVRFDARSFADLRRTAQIRSETRRALDADPLYAAETPREVSFQLTYQCNLRCKHCYQWNEQGFLRTYDSKAQKNELPLGIIESVLDATDSTRAKVFLWGGEPMLHSRFADIMALLRSHERTTNICTNGLQLTNQLPALRLLGERLNLLVSLDGFETDHNALRGRGTFQRTIRQIEHLLQEKRDGRLQAEISLSCMVSNETAGQLYAFAEWASRLGVNSVYFQFPWFIGPEAAFAMDRLYATELSWLRAPPAAGTGTWHSYTYRVLPENVAILRDQLSRIAARTWPIRIRYQPEVAEEELEDFLAGSPSPVQGKQRCLAVSNRLEVHADGKVSSCKFFPEFVVGDLHAEDVISLWRGDAFRRVREVMRGSGLFPVCSRCILLYLNGD